MADNLLAATGDPSFESGTGSPTVSTNATYARTASTAMYGNYVGQLTVTTDGAATLSMPGTYSPPVTPGQIYSISAYIQQQVGTLKAARIDYRWLDSSRTVLTGTTAYGGTAGTNGTLLGPTATPSATGNAGRIRVTYPAQTAPTGAAFLNIRIGIVSALTNDVFWVDAVQIEQSSTVSTYNENVPAAGFPVTYALDGQSANVGATITTSTVGTGDTAPSVITGSPKIGSVFQWANNPCVKMDQVAGTSQLLRFQAFTAVDKLSFRVRWNFGATDSANSHGLFTVNDNSAAVLWRAVRTTGGLLRVVDSTGTQLAQSSAALPQSRWLHVEVTNDNTLSTNKSTVKVYYWNTRVQVLPTLTFSGWTGTIGQVWFGNNFSATAPAEPWYQDGVSIVNSATAPTWFETNDPRPSIQWRNNGVLGTAKISYWKSGGVLQSVVGAYVANPTNVNNVALPRLSRDAATGYIMRNGTQFRTAGANAFQLVLNDYPSNRLMSHAEIDSILDSCVSMGIKLLRVHTLGINIGSNSYNLVTGVSGTTTPVISYNAAVWEVMDYVVYAAGQRGIYLMAPLTDELGYYHGGKRNWVNFRRAGTCSTDFNVKSANSSTERAAENYFYTDSQIVLDFRKYVSDWLNHINQYNNVAYKNDPTIAIVEGGNEMWTAAQDAPTWMPGLATYIESIAPNVLIADCAATDGQAIVSSHLNSTAIDIHGTHPYTTYGAADVTSMAATAKAAGKAFLVGEYPWSKAAASAIESAARSAYNVFSTAFWSLQNTSDLHNNGASYGGDDVSLYYPGKDSTQTAAVSRLTSHASVISSTLDAGNTDNGNNTPTGAQVVNAATTLTTLSNPDSSGTIATTTGLVVSNKNSEFTAGTVYWAVTGTDAAPKIYAFDNISPYSITATYTLGGVASGTGFAEIAEGPGPVSGTKYLYILQAPSGGSTWYVHRIAEPTITINQTAVTSTIAAANVVTFQIAPPFTSCSAMVVDSITGDLFLFENKTDTARPSLAQVRVYANVNSMTASTTIPGVAAGTITAIQSSTANTGITGADISLDGRLLAICNSQEVWLYNRPGGQTIQQMLKDPTTTPVRKSIALNSEAIALDMGEDPASFTVRAAGGTAPLRTSALTYDTGTGTGTGVVTGAYPVLNVLKLGVNNDGNYPGSKCTNVYYQENQSALSTTQLNAIKARLDNGEGVFMTWTSATTKDMPQQIIAGNASAIQWVNEIVASGKTLADYAATLNNKSFVALNLWHESKAQTTQKGLTATGQQFGQAQKIFGQKVKAAITNGRGFFLVWIVASDRAFEAAQFAELTNPRPDIISIDPYANSNGTQTPSSIASADLQWCMAQPSYFQGQYFAITETAMATNISATEAQLATFYTDWPTKWQAIATSLGIPMCAVTFFNSDTTSPTNPKTHVITQAGHPQAFNALTASLAAQQT